MTSTDGVSPQIVQIRFDPIASFLSDREDVSFYTSWEWNANQFVVGMPSVQVSCRRGNLLTPYLENRSLTFHVKGYALLTLVAWNFQVSDAEKVGCLKILASALPNRTEHMRRKEGKEGAAITSTTLWVKTKQGNFANYSSLFTVNDRNDTIQLNKWLPIFTVVLLLADSQVNLSQSRHEIYHDTLQMSLHYLVKCQSSKIAVIKDWVKQIAM